MGYRPVAFEGEGSNCFSITQLVGQKIAIIYSAKKNYLGIKINAEKIGLQNQQSSLLKNDYY